MNTGERRNDFIFSLFNRGDFYQEPRGPSGKPPPPPLPLCALSLLSQTVSLERRRLRHQGTSAPMLMCSWTAQFVGLIFIHIPGVDVMVTDEELKGHTQAHNAARF